MEDLFIFTMRYDGGLLYQKLGHNDFLSFTDTLMSKWKSTARTWTMKCNSQIKSNRIYDGVEAETWKSQTRFQII